MSIPGAAKAPRRWLCLAFPRFMKDSTAIAIVCTVAILGMLSIAYQFRDRVFTGFNDFVAFYSGARLAGTSDLYSAARARQVQEDWVGVTGDAWRYIRLPWFAAFLRPLGKLPYVQAYLIWEVLALGAFAGFVLLWRSTSFPVTLLFSTLSLPAFASLMDGQDVTFLLLWIALATWYQRRNRPFAAGAVFSLCGAKYHLFLLVPLLAVERKNRRFLWGLVSGGAILLAISFWVAGPRWPWAYYSVLLDPNIHRGQNHMPNLHGLFYGWPQVRAVIWLSAPLVAAAVAMIAARMPFEYSLAAALLGGMLISYHAEMPDCALLLPAALILVTTTKLRALRILSVMMLVPVTYMLLVSDPPFSAAVPIAMLSMLGLMGAEAYRCAVAPVLDGMTPGGAARRPEPVRANALP